MCCHEGVTNRDVMMGTFILLSEDVAQVDLTVDVLEFNVVLLDLFTDSIFADLDVAETFGC